MAIRDFTRNTHPRGGADNPNHTSTVRPRLYVVAPGTTVDDAADATLEVLKEMQHPVTRFTDPIYASVDLRRLAREFDSWLAGKERPVKLPSRKKYGSSLKSLFASIKANGDPLELSHLHPMTVTRWIAEQRGRNLSEDGIASRLASVKVFSHAFIYRKLELSDCDLLEKVSRFTPPPKPMPVLSEAEIEQLLGYFNDTTFEGIRDRAMVAVLLATGARRGELHRMTMGDYDAIASEMTIQGKNGQVRWAGLSDRCHRLLRAYMKVRPRGACQDL